MKWDDVPWATIVAVTLTVVAAVTGAAVVVFGDEGALSFETYLDVMSKFAIGVGVLGVGRGILKSRR